MQSAMSRRMHGVAARSVLRSSWSKGCATATPSGTSSRCSSAIFGAAAVGGAGALLAASKWASGPVSAQESGVSLAQLEKRVKDLEVGQAERICSAVVFIKPHAVTDKVQDLVAARFAAEGITVLSEGHIKAERIDKDALIDTHYGAIAARAMKQKPSELIVQKAAQEEFEKVFGLSWQAALDKKLVFNLADGAEKLGCSMDELGNKYDKLKKGVDMLKFGGGFYCGKIGDIYVINGFYAKMRSQFTVPGQSIYYYEVEWDPKRLAWADFRGSVLGGTDPKTAESKSLRHVIFKTWKDLGLDAEPNTGNNGMHASASPFEALAERCNWLGVSLEHDAHGRAMLALGLPAGLIKTWFDDPAVPFQGKRQSLFDLLEDLNSRECLKKAVLIAAGR